MNSARIANLYQFSPNILCKIFHEDETTGKNGNKNAAKMQYFRLSCSHFVHFV